MPAKPKRKPPPVQQVAFLPFDALKVVELLRAGNYLETAAHSAGLRPETVRKWRRLGARARRRMDVRGPLQSPNTTLFAALARPGAYLPAWLIAFADACDRAESEAESIPVLLWKKAMTEHPALAEKFLMRRFPGRWGDRAPTIALEQALLELKVEFQKMRNEGTLPPDRLAVEHTPELDLTKLSDEQFAEFERLRALAKRSA